MRLDPATEQRVRAEAAKRGVDPDAAVAHAESLAPAEKPAKGDTTSTDGRPVADRMLIGFLPFVKVHELRSLWLGLPDRIADDEMTCGDYQIKHGGAPAAATAEPSA